MPLRVSLIYLIMRGNKSMRYITVTFEDGNTIDTAINGTNESINEYYIGNYFDFGDTEEHPQSKMIKAVSVKFHDEQEESQS